MGDLLRQGSQWLAGVLNQHAASPVTYRRGEIELELQATFGRTEYEVEDGYGLRVAAHVTDFLILAADLTPAFGEPEAGDQIVALAAASGQAAVFEVMGFAGQGHWRWSDPARTLMRIHTKETGTE